MDRYLDNRTVSMVLYVCLVFPVRFFISASHLTPHTPHPLLVHALGSPPPPPPQGLMILVLKRRPCTHLKISHHFKGFKSKDSSSKSYLNTSTHTNTTYAHTETHTLHTHRDTHSTHTQRHTHTHTNSPHDSRCL